MAGSSSTSGSVQISPRVVVDVVVAAAAIVVVVGVGISIVSVVGVAVMCGIVSTLFGALIICCVAGDSIGAYRYV